MQLADGGRRVAVLANAADEAPEEIRHEAVNAELEALKRLQLEPEELDLRSHFNGHDAAGALRRYDIVWVRGGNVFVLRYALARSGADRALIELLREDAIVYGGYSAGPCVLAPSLRGLDLVDDPSAVERLYEDQPLWDGLAVLDFAVVPHVDSPDHPESAACGLVADEYRRLGTPHKTLRDGEVLVIDGSADFICR